MGSRRSTSPAQPDSGKQQARLQRAQRHQSASPIRIHFLELRPKFGPGMVTGFMRIEGRPFGVIANNCYAHGRRD